MASQADEAFAGYQASGPVPQDEGKISSRFEAPRADAAVVRPNVVGVSHRAHERNKQGRCMRLANTMLVPVPAAGAARSSQALLPKRAVMAVAAFGLVGFASVVLSRQGTAVEQHSAELSKKHPSKQGSDQGEVYGRRIYRQRVMAECCCYWVS